MALGTVMFLSVLNRKAARWYSDLQCGLGPGTSNATGFELQAIPQQGQMTLFSDELADELALLAEDAQDYNTLTIPRINNPTALEFHRFVASNRPVIITLSGSTTAASATNSFPDGSHATKDTHTDQPWPAYTKWTKEYLVSTMGSKEVTVACTPNGWADAVVNGEFFAMPHEKTMSFAEFAASMPDRSMDANGNISEPKMDEARNHRDEVRYIQLQNGNLRTEFQDLQNDVPEEISFATEALGKSVDAVNFWYGDERSTTSLHKDHYENLYAVIAGEKIFTLIPPTEQFCLHEQEYVAAQYTPSTAPSAVNGYELVPLDPLTHTKWIALNPSRPRSELISDFPRFKYCQPLKAHVRPGELLYLPAMWYHQVEQKPDLEGKCIAVNWWYDMGFEGERFAVASFITKLIKLVDRDPRRKSCESKSEANVDDSVDD